LPAPLKSRDLLDRGVKSPTPEQVESTALAELEAEVKILRQAAAAVEQVVPPKARFALVTELAAEGIAAKQLPVPRRLPSGLLRSS
jgi:hypothetical protein